MIKFLQNNLLDQSVTFRRNTASVEEKSELFLAMLGDIHIMPLLINSVFSQPFESEQNIHDQRQPVAGGMMSVRHHSVVKNSTENFLLRVCNGPLAGMLINVCWQKELLTVRLSKIWFRDPVKIKKECQDLSGALGIQVILEDDDE